ncbi:sodium-dependent transporter [Salininema proteolyticum]|uniref:Sodium-dependent transporter n=1 Tax=Salininema proteolyticum TaxID=1607685 RepID=A0ABV8U281_9ACTN
MTGSVRETWGSRAGFLLAAVGSAIGLGNIWRFPGEAYESGGGAFLIPWMVAILTAGIPLLILEYTIGHRSRKSGPSAFRSMSKNAEGIGWWQVAVAILLATFYASILAWAVSYTFFSVTASWGDEPGAYFTEFLNVSGEVYQFGEFNWGIFGALAGVWVVSLVIMAGGVRKGVELANKVCIPLLVVLFGALVVRAVTLPGALDGLNTFFTPDWNALGDYQVWVAAYGQVFFSLSIGMGTMIAYASYLRKKSELTMTATTAGLANASFELLAGIGVFAALGFMAYNSGGPVIDEQNPIVGGGLAFVTFPTILNEMPGTELFGFLFFGSLVVAGVSSLISMLIVPLASFQDRFGWDRKKTVLVIGIPMALVSLAVYPTRNGPMILDAVDQAVTPYGLVMAGLASIIAAFASGKIGRLASDANRYSILKLGAWWYAFLGITAVVLVYILLFNLVPDQIDWYLNPKEGNTLSPDQVLITWSVGAASILFGLVMGVVMRNKPVPQTDEDLENAEEEASA